MKKIGKISILIIVIITVITAQERGFPIHLRVKNCIKPSHISQKAQDSTISDYYKYWKIKYVERAVSTENSYYIKSGGGTGGSDGLITISEAHGYGMLIAALMAGSGVYADSLGKTLFDGLYRFYNAHRSSICDDLMSWEVLSDGKGGESSKAADAATDGDMDIAYALLLAHYQWGSSDSINYLNEAKRIISAIEEFETNPNNFRIMLGDWVYSYDNSSDEWELDPDFKLATRSSDWMVGHLYAYEKATSKAYWGSVRDKIYEMIDEFVPAHSQTTGLLSDFIVKNPVEPAPEKYLDEFKETNQYYQNACRTPLRLVADWVHNDRAEVKPFLNKILTWLKTTTNNNPDSIFFGYNISTGAPLYPDSVSMCFTAPLIAACMVDSSHQEYLNAGWDTMSKNRDTYYPDCLNLLSMLMITGNWWAPTDSLDTLTDTTTATILSHNNRPKIPFKIAKQRNLLNIKLQENSSNKNIKISLFEINGQKLNLTILQNNINDYSIDLSSLSTGVYLVQVSYNNRKFTKKFSILKR